MSKEIGRQNFVAAKLGKLFAVRNNVMSTAHGTVFGRINV